jgi:magnesium chelatase family protein
MVAKVLTVAQVGFDGALVEVEGDAKNGLPAIQIVGMGNKAIDEARERVRSAITNSLLDFPARKLTINLAPAELPKDGAYFDLPIALAILVLSGQLKQNEVSNAIFAGELALDGSLRPIRGAITIAEPARQTGHQALYLPATNVAQASLIEGIEIIGVKNLKDLFLHLKHELIIAPTPQTPVLTSKTTQSHSLTIDDIRGQEQAKRALVIAAAGHHNLLFNGPPGSGKTMLAQAMPSLLSSLSPLEQIEVTKIYSLAGEIDGGVVTNRPFRSPHHTASQLAIIGGGGKPKPGEISLAHRGVLFLDELPEYSRSTLEALRQPLEDKTISISRANGHIRYPANFMLIATMNPCPCGYYGDPVKECVCTSTQILAYQKRLSGPLLDRIDLFLTVSRTSNDVLLQAQSLTINQHRTEVSKIETAKNKQNERYKSSHIYNGFLTGNEVRRHIALPPAGRSLLANAADKLNLSARSYFKIIKVARTIADLDDSTDILPEHMSEALRYRAENTT